METTEAAAIATASSDKDKLRALYRAIQAIEIPEMMDKDYTETVASVEWRLNDTLNFIKNEAKQMD